MAAAATAEVVSALLAEAVVAASVLTTGAAIELLAVADGVVAPTEVAGVDEAVLTKAAAECFEFDWLSAGIDVGSGAEVAGVLGAVGSTVSPEAAGPLDFGSASTGLAVPVAGVVDVPVPMGLVCAPPLLLTMTPDPTSVLEDVAPDVLAVPVAVVAVLVAVDPLVDVAPLPVVIEVEVPAGEVVAGPVDDSPVGVELADVVDDDSEDVPVVSAAANP